MDQLQRNWQDKLAALDARVAEMERDGASAEVTALGYYRQALLDCLQDYADERHPAGKDPGKPTSWTQYGAWLREM